MTISWRETSHISYILSNIARHPLFWAKPLAVKWLPPRLLDFYLNLHGAAESILNRELRNHSRTLLAEQCMLVPNSRGYRVSARQLSQNRERLTLPLSHPYWRNRVVRHDIAGREHIAHCLSVGRGGVLLASHFGAWPSLKQELERHGFHLNLTYPLNWPNIQASYDQPARVQFLQLARRELARNGLVGLMGDGGAVDRPKMGRMITFPFFGSNAPFPVGAAYLSVKTSAPLMPFFSVRHIDARHEIIVTPPINPHSYTGTAKERAIQMTACYVQRLEEVIKLYPYNACAFLDALNPN